jgi:mRNA interferase MazF
MALSIHPEQGTIVICDFSGFQSPEMTKKRPAIVVSPRFRNRGNLCAVVPLSTTAPIPVMPYHYRLQMDEPLPAPYDADMHWVKADMVYTLSFARLSLPFEGKDASGKRIYDVRVVDASDLKKIQCCVLHGMGLASLTEHLA